MKESEYWNAPVETMPLEQLKEIQFKKIKSIAKHAYNNSRWYHKLYDEANVKPDDIQTLDDFKKLPYFRKDDVREERAKTGDPFAGILAVPLERVLSIHPSTGTTGVPTFNAYMREDLDTMSSVALRNLWMMKLRPGMRMVMNPMMWHYYSAAYNTGFKRICASMGINASIPHPVTAPHMYNAIARLKPDFGVIVLDLVLGLNDLCKRLGVEPRDVFSSLKYVMDGMGEPVTPELRKTLIDMWGLEDFWDTGGLSDGFVVCSDCYTHTGQHIWGDHYYVELIDTETEEPLGPGERGEYLVTNLFALGHPYVRFATEDFAYLNEDACECGRTHPRIRVFSRTGWVFDIDGRKINPYDVRLVLEKFPETREASFTMIKTKGKMDKLKLKAAYDQELTKDLDDLTRRVKEAIKSKLGVDSEIEWATWEEIPKIFHKIQRITDLSKE
ncbi:MAG: phenylacetate--CoA ligase family protein [Candidatus Freyrarchaeum guaymaensis]